MHKRSQEMWAELKELELSGITPVKICRHISPKIEIGKRLPSCTKCGLPLGLMHPDDTWEWE